MVSTGIIKASFAFIVILFVWVFIESAILIASGFNPVSSTASSAFGAVGLILSFVCIVLTGLAYHYSDYLRSTLSSISDGKDINSVDTAVKKVKILHETMQSKQEPKQEPKHEETPAPSKTQERVDETGDQDIDDGLT